MKKINLIILPLIILITGTTISCERDDICPGSTTTTPRLIIDIFDNENQDNKKNVFKLLVEGIGNNNVLPGYGIVTKNNLILPLKTTADSTQYALIKDTTIDDKDTPDDNTDDVISGGNKDIITITYTRKEVYASRACGYKTIFENVKLIIEPDDDNWIQFSQAINDIQSVEDETTTHFNIFH